MEGTRRSDTLSLDSVISALVKQFLVIGARQALMPLSQKCHGNRRNLGKCLKRETPQLTTPVRVDGTSVRSTGASQMGNFCTDCSSAPDGNVLTYPPLDD